MTNVVSVTDATFDEEVGAAPEPVLVDFWATWCGPCKMLDPVLEDIATEHNGRLRVRRIDVDENPTVVQRFGVLSMPTLMLFDGGEPRLRLVGARGKGRLLEELRDWL